MLVVLLEGRKSDAVTLRSHRVLTAKNHNSGCFSSSQTHLSCAFEEVFKMSHRAPYEELQVEAQAESGLFCLREAVSHVYDL